MKTRFFVLASAILLLSCSSIQPDQSGEVYQTTRKAIYNAGNIEIEWAEPQRVDVLCRHWGNKMRNYDGLFGGCARSKPDVAGTCQIIAAEPRSFDDTVRLTLLGHELWHCMGALHQ